MTNKNDHNQREIPINNVEIKEDFRFFDYNSTATIGYLKEYFLTTFGQKYHFCKCLFSLYQKISGVFVDGKYQLLSNDHKKNLSEFGISEFYLIKTNANCDCEYKMYTEYMNMEKFDIIAKLKTLETYNINQENQIDNLKKANNTKKSQIEVLEKENKELKKEIEKLKKIEEIKNYKKSKFEDFYDIVIDINSIKSVNKEGWKVKFNDKGLEKFNQHKDQELIILGVIGNNNKGKSFLLSKLSKIKLLTGTSIQTEGLSVKYPELIGFKGRQIILLDSAGLETPVLVKKIKENEEENVEENEDTNEELEEKKINEGDELKDESNKIIIDKEFEQNKEFKDNARDKIMTELFLQNFLIRVSDILLVVVGKLSYSEQLLINKIKEESKKQNKGKIFIIHNLQEFGSVEQVQNYIKETLLNCTTFNLKKRTWISTEKDNETQENHKENKIQINEINNNINNINNIDNIIQEKKDKNEIIIENEHPEPEKKNEQKINEENVLEESKLTDIHFTEILNYGDQKKLEVYHLIIANENSQAGEVYNQYTYNFIENVYNLISEPKKFDIFEQVKENFKKLSNTILNDNIEEIPFNDNQKILEDKIMKLEYDKELSLKKCFTDELGFSLFKTGDFEPKYNIFKPDENTIEIRLEVPGNATCDVSHKVEGDETIITVTGKKTKDNMPKDMKDNLFNLREFSNFEVNIPLKVYHFKINQSKPKDGYPKFKNGVCCIQYELASKGEKVTANPEESL